ncbi:Hypothetical protein CINCED_3A004685 [Cinara cedri]|uniref:Uncharacterized protein n=1 Tax=Cinara cedri TaxID=506608 RepID=A0A5E4NI56_9HEMI|nr:Hypothetical protein CINCED_3A004685 [Cinara cedri]
MIWFTMEQNNQKKKIQKSGFLKRKEQNKKCLDEIASKSKKMTNFFTPTVLNQDSAKLKKNQNLESNQIEFISEKVLSNSPLISQVHITSNIDSTTRWRCKSDSVQNIFGRADMWIVEAQHGERKSFIYVKIVLSLYEISQSNDFNVNVRSNARSLLGRLTSYETTLTAMTFIHIFKLTTPLSDYLQTSNLDYIQVYKKIVVTEKLLKQNQRNFTPISTAAKIFINFVSEKI